MGDKRRSSLLSLLRRAGPKEEKKKEPAPATAFERQVSAPSQLASPREEQKKTKEVKEKDGKSRKPVERRESSRLQSAAKLLRSLSKSKDLQKDASSSNNNS